MKKLTCLLVMLLLGSGLTQAIIFRPYGDNPTFSLWNVQNNTTGEPITIINGIDPVMYFGFTSNHNIERLSMQILLTIYDYTVQIPTTEEPSNCIINTSLPVLEGEYVEIVMTIPFPNITNLSGDITIIFFDQNHNIVASGVSSFIIE